MTSGHFTDHDTWFAQLPGVVVAAGALITDPAGQVLIVKPNYRDHWTLPGGICEQGEAPHAGCAREVEEEVGLIRPAGCWRWTGRSRTARRAGPSCISCSTAASSARARASSCSRRNWMAISSPTRAGWPATRRVT